MDVFDSNIWLHGCLYRNSEPAQLVTEAARGERDVTVSPYIYSEVINRFRNPKGRHDFGCTEEAMNLFTDLVVGSETITVPRHKAVKEVDVNELPREPEYQLLARLLSIQAKDAPVVADAWGLGRKVDLYTCDLELAECDLSSHGIGIVTTHHVTPP